MTSKEQLASNPSVTNSKVSNGNSVSMFNGVNGETASTENGSSSSATNISVIGTSSESPGNMSGENSGQANIFLTAGPGNLPMSYSPFTSVDGSWTPTAYDPSLMTAFGFTGAGLMSGQALANSGFYFPGTTDIWGQENSAAAAAAVAAAAQNPLMLNSFMMNPLSMDQQQQLSGSEVVAMDGNVTTIDPMIGLTPSFSGLTVNGAVPNVMQLNQTTVLPNTPGTPGGIEGAGSTGTLAPSLNTAPQPEKPKSWAAIASQPAKPRPPPPPKPQPQPESSNESVASSNRKSGGGRGGGSNGGSGQNGRSSQGQSGGSQAGSGKGQGSRKVQQNQTSQSSTGGGANARSAKSSSQSELVGKLKSENKYNPSELTINLTNARFFVIKSYAEDDIHRSIKYNIWTSTEHGNRRLDQAFREQKGKGGVYLFFSVNGSGHFCGVAQMMSEVDFTTITGVWAQDKWKGRFEVKWIYVKDVPNSQLRHIRLENNENKPVTNSRDTQEVPLAKARQVIKIVHTYQHTTSIFDDFDHYEKKQEEDKKST